MTDLNTTIGLLCIDYSTTEVVTVQELKDEIKGGCHFTPQQYCDFRYGTNLQRFLYDPFTGKKIDWKEVKSLLVG
jgi:hypothetical protein